MPSNTINDLSIYKQQQVYVYNSSGAFLDTWQDAPLLAGFKEAINTATTPLRIQLPRSFDNFDQAGAPGSKGTVAQGNNVQFWIYGPGLPAGGKLRYQGIIDSYEPQIAENGEESVTISITPYDSVLGDHGLTGTQAFGTPGSSGTYVDAVTMFNWFFSNNDTITGLPFMSPLTLDATNPASSGNVAQYTFNKQTMNDVFTTILNLLPANWFFRINPDKTVTLNVAATSAQHVMYVGQNVANPLYKQDWNTLKNVIVLKGSNGVTGTQVVSVKTGSDVSTFGERLLLVEDTRIGDGNSASIIAQGYLNANDRVLLRSTLRVPDYRGDETSGGATGVGYDIESLKVGDTILIVDALSPNNSKQTLWDTSTWDVDYWDYSPGAALNQVVQIVGLSYNFDYVDLELGTLQPSQDRALWRMQQRLALLGMS